MIYISPRPHLLAHLIQVFSKQLEHISVFAKKKIIKPVIPGLVSTQSQQQHLTHSVEVNRLHWHWSP